MEWEEAEKILSWREMQPGVYTYHGIDRRGTNDYGRPISVVTLEREGVKKMFCAPSSLYWELKNREETNFIKYEGNQTSARGYEYPVFKFSTGPPKKKFMDKECAVCNGLFRGDYSYEQEFMF